MRMNREMKLKCRKTGRTNIPEAKNELAINCGQIRYLLFVLYLVTLIKTEFLEGF